MNSGPPWSVRMARRSPLEAGAARSSARVTCSPGGQEAAGAGGGERQAQEAADGVIIGRRDAEGVPRPKALTPQVKLEAVTVMAAKAAISQRRACRLVGLSRKVLSYEARAREGNAQLGTRTIELAAERRCFGCRRIHALLRRQGAHANHKRVYRLYREAGLALRRRRKQARVAVEREPLLLPQRPNEAWPMDFVMDALSRERRLKCLMIVDDRSKEAVKILVDHSIPAPPSRRTGAATCRTPRH